MPMYGRSIVFHFYYTLYLISLYFIPSPNFIFDQNLVDQNIYSFDKKKFLNKPYISNVQKWITKGNDSSMTEQK